MRYRDFLGRKVSVIAMGSTGIGFDFSQRQTNEFLDRYFELGGNFIDTARVYGDFSAGINGIAERAIGNWLKARKNRDRIILGTKGAHPLLTSMNVSRLSREDIFGDMDASLADLMVDYVDIYWLHRDDESKPTGEIIETLNELIKAGKTRYIGASNWSWYRIKEANEYAEAHGLAGFVANQPQYSLAKLNDSYDPTLREMNREMYAYHEENKLTCVPFSSQAKGFFIKYHDGGAEALPEKARSRFLTKENLAIYDKLVKLSNETGYSVGALSLAYLTCQDFDVFPIVGVSRLSQVDALEEAGDAVITHEQALSLRNIMDE